MTGNGTENLARGKSLVQTLRELEIDLDSTAFPTRVPAALDDLEAKAGDGELSAGEAGAYEFLRLFQDGPVALRLKALDLDGVLPDAERPHLDQAIEELAQSRYPDPSSRQTFRRVLAEWSLPSRHSSTSG